MSQLSDQWAAGSTYEQFMGRWSRKLATQYVAWLQPATQLHWLDLGCGTGALTEAIFQSAAPASVIACDPAEPFIEYARQHFRHTSAAFVIAGADNFPAREGGYDVIASLLALNFFPDSRLALDRMRRSSAPGGSSCGPFGTRLQESTLARPNSTKADGFHYARPIA
jgi:ubiquinone/menaquinone biosynthesis C-methylase UbiE